jgi:hypothetical protein
LGVCQRLGLLSSAPDNKQRILKKIHQNNSLEEGLFSAPADYWQRDTAAGALVGVGPVAMLSLPKTAFFASRQCPGKAIRAAMDWAVVQVRAGQALVSGFHSLLEQSVPQLCLAAKSPAVVVLARPVPGARPAAPWAEAVGAGHLTVVWAVGGGSLPTPRLTAEAARARNDVAAALASRVVVAHAATNGQLSAQFVARQAAGLTVDCLLSG